MENQSATITETQCRIWSLTKFSEDPATKRELLIMSGELGGKPTAWEEELQNDDIWFMLSFRASKSTQPVLGVNLSDTDGQGRRP